MTNIQQYVRTLYVRNMHNDLGIPASFMRRDEVVEHLTARALAVIADYKVSDKIDLSPIVDLLFSEMLESGCFSELADDFAGKYYQLVPNQIGPFRQQVLVNDVISQQASAIGEERYFGDVFAAFVDRSTEEPTVAGLGLSVPASDRVVTLSDNQVPYFELKTTEIIDVVSNQNQIDNEPGLREIILGQLKAGRELLRAGSFSLYIFQLTLLDTLRFLAKRYEKEAIGALAAALIGELLKSIGIIA